MASCALNQESTYSIRRTTLSRIAIGQTLPFTGLKEPVNPSAELGYTHRMSTDEKPKSAVELAMERLRRRDTDSGVTERPVTDEQKAAIAEARSVHGSKIAELEILHRATMAGVFDPTQREQAADDYRREMQRLNEDLERKITRIRAQGD